MVAQLPSFVYAQAVSPVEIDPGSGSSTAELALAPATGLLTDVPIGKIDGVMLRLNIALPEERGDEPHPVLVYIHGGGLIGGDKNDHNVRIERMAKKGFVAASITYRLAPEHRFPAQLVDVQSAIRFLKAHAIEFNLDPERIVVSGPSAGGYLATMLGVTGNATGFAKYGIYPDYDSSVLAVIAFSAPIADFSQASFKEFTLVDRIINTESDDRRSALEAISPVTYLDVRDPPFFLVHGTSDSTVPVEMTRGFVRALEDIGHRYTYIEIDGGEHNLTSTRPAEASEAFEESLKFIVEHTTID